MKSVQLVEQKRMQSHEAYKALPAKVSQQILMVLDNNWKGFTDDRFARGVKEEADRQGKRTRARFP